LKIDELKEQLGMKHKDMPSRMSLYVLYRLVQMQLHYLMAIKLNRPPKSRAQSDREKEVELPTTKPPGKPSLGKKKTPKNTDLSEAGSPGFGKSTL